MICRYYLYRRSGGASSNAEIEALYEKQQSNPAILEIVGTFAPLFADERIVTGPVGRLLISNVAQIPTPPGSSNNGNGFIALAPAVLQRNGNTISADFSGTFPDYFQTDSGANPKYDFGPVTLIGRQRRRQRCHRAGRLRRHRFRRSPRLDLRFRYLVECRRPAGPAGSRRQIQPAARAVRHGARGDRLLFRLEPAGHLCRAARPGDCFPEPGDHRAGNRLGLPSRPRTDPADCPPITVWQYRSVPIQSPGDVEAIATNFKPGQHAPGRHQPAGQFSVHVQHRRRRLIRHRPAFRRRATTRS